jgi:hypothetical protein
MTAVEVVFYDLKGGEIYSAPCLFQYAGMEEGKWVWSNATKIEFCPSRPPKSTFHIKIDHIPFFSVKFTESFKWSDGCVINLIPGAIKIEEIAGDLE